MRSRGGRSAMPDFVGSGMRDYRSDGAIERRCDAL